MSRPELTIRPARVADAPALAQAERTIAATPGLLVSQPAELTDDRFAQKIAALEGADNGRYLVAEMAGQLNVRSSNMPAQLLYRKLGFAEIGRWRRKVKVAPGQYLDDVAMELLVK